MKPHPNLAGLALLATLAAPAALAQAEARLDTRASTVHLAYGGGFATAGKNLTVGSLDPIDLTGPASPGETGADSFTGGYLGWAVSWQVDWDIAQTWAVDPTQRVLSGSGHTRLGQSSAVIGPGCAPCTASMGLYSHNWQDLEFVLDAPAVFAFHSEVSLNQGVQINRWDEARQRWFPFVSSVAGGVANRSGTLDAGRWQVVNSRTVHVLGSTPAALDEHWAFSLTLPGVQWVSAVPEPASALLLLPGLALLAWRRRLSRA
ncbi:PEP-CTERM motif protein [Burkholderiales bacterium JOSHI_001]|nr:PEP-CTERM motif protein [Burkholderiales bacterium JOSHI_001]